MLFTGDAGTTAHMTIGSTGKVGLGTTTPWAQLSINPNGISGPSFVIGSSTATNFIVTNGGNVGIGTTTPSVSLVVAGTGGLHVTGSNPVSFNGGAGIEVSGGTAPYVQAYNRNTNAYLTLRNIAGAFIFEPSGTEVVRINSTGVGIGTTTPWAKLSIHANNGETNKTLFAIASSTASATTTLFSIDNTGLTTIGDSSGSGDANFQFAGDINAWSVGYKSSDKSFNIASSTNLTGTAALSIAKNGNTTIVGSAVTCTIGNGSSATSCSSSDSRLKTNIAPLQTQDGLAAIMALNPVSYHWNAWMQSNGSASTTQFGFIAQDVQNVFPTLVSQDAHSGYYKLDYQGFAGPTIKAIQDLNLKLEDLATTTATSTDSASFTSRFFSSLFARITQWFADTSNGIGDFFAKRVHTDELCVGSTCVTQSQFLAMVAAASGSAPTSPAASGGAAANDNGSPSSPTLIVNGNDPAQWQQNAPYQDNLGALFTHSGFSETVYSTSTVDVAQSGTSTLDYWAVVPSTQQWLHATRAVVVSAPTDSAPPAANDNPPPPSGDVSTSSPASDNEASSTPQAASSATP